MKSWMVLPEPPAQQCLLNSRFKKHGDDFLKILDFLCRKYAKLPGYTKWRFRIVCAVHAVGLWARAGARVVRAIGIAGAAKLIGKPRAMSSSLFFVSLGTLIDPKVLLNNLPLLGWMLLLIVAGKFLVWTTVVWLFRYPLRIGIAVAAGLTQIGELSFVVVQVARSSELVTEKVFSAVIAASLISILLNVFLVRGVFAWIGKEPPKQARTDFAERSAHGDPRGEMAAQQASLA
jgi:hypothetical protein